jgi:ArsR family transcriptional regulator
MSKVFKALSHPTRRAILRMLREREMSAGEIADRP